MGVGALVSGTLPVAVTGALDDTMVTGLAGLAIGWGQAIGFYRIGFDLLFR